MKKKISMKSYLSLFGIILVALDQATKYWARRTLAGTSAVFLIDKVLSFTYVENRGGVWGMMQGRYNIFAIVSVVIIVGIVYVLYRIPNTKRFFPLYLSMIFILAGAIGNLIDRIVFGFVTDFISFDIINFPVFNVADIYVTVSAFVTAFLLCFFYKESEIDFLPFFSEKKESPKQKNDDEK